MQDQLEEILNLIKATFKYKWLIIIVAWSVCLPGWWYVSQMPDKYRSIARVQVDTRTMLRPLLSGLAIQSDLRGMVLIMKQLMFTRQHLEKIAELAGMGINAKSEEAKLAVINQLKRKIRIGGGQNEIFSISFESKDPLEAKHVVQSVLTVFSIQTQQSALDDMDSAQRFLLNQIQEYEQRLRNAEKARENFKRANIGMLPGQGEDQVGPILKLNNALEEAKLSLSELYSRKQVLEEQLKEAKSSEIEDDWILSADQTKVDPRLRSLLAKREELLIRYTSKHPSIKAIDRRIESIRKSKAEEAGVEVGDDLTSVPINPFAQSIKASINEVDAQIASMKSRITAYENKIEKLNQELNERLSIETQMQNLNRDYNTIKGNYQTLLQRREQAKITEKVDNEATTLRFKVADPPNKPLKPTGPNRELYYSIVLGIGLAAGLALALLAALIKPMFLSVNQIKNITGLPILGSISVVRSPKEIRRLKLKSVQYVLACGLLVSAYTGMIILKS